MLQQALSELIFATLPVANDCRAKLGLGASNFATITSSISVLDRQIERRTQAS